MKPIATCFECTHAHLSVGYDGERYGNPPSAPEPPMAECTRADIPHEIFEMTEEEAANHCGHFDPLMAESCSNCGQSMNVPAWLWPYWAGNWADKEPCCCQECLDERQAVIDADMGIPPTSENEEMLDEGDSVKGE